MSGLNDGTNNWDNSFEKKGEDTNGDPTFKLSAPACGVVTRKAGEPIIDKVNGKVFYALYNPKIYKTN